MSILIFIHAFCFLNLDKITMNLYVQVMFRTEFLGEFLSVLLLGLAEGGWRALARDEVTAAVHAMALVDFAAFRSAFLPHFLASLPGLSPEHQHHLAQFPPDTVSSSSNDGTILRYYHTTLTST